MQHNTRAAELEAPIEVGQNYEWTTEDYEQHVHVLSIYVSEDGETQIRVGECDVKPDGSWKERKVTVDLESFINALHDERLRLLD